MPHPQTLRHAREPAMMVVVQVVVVLVVVVAAAAAAMVEVPVSSAMAPRSLGLLHLGRLTT